MGGNERSHVKHEARWCRNKDRTQPNTSVMLLKADFLGRHPRQGMSDWFLLFLLGSPLPPWEVCIWRLKVVREATSSSESCFPKWNG